MNAIIDRLKEANAVHFEAQKNNLYWSKEVLRTGRALREVENDYRNAKYDTLEAQLSTVPNAGIKL